MRLKCFQFVLISIESITDIKRGQAKKKNFFFLIRTYRSHKNELEGYVIVNLSRKEGH